MDLATAAPPEVVIRLFPHTVPVGIRHGTVGVLDRRRHLHEVTTFRRDVETDGRHAVVSFGASLDEDLARRDFTINAIAYHPIRHQWRDPFGGREDLDAGVVRAVGPPRDRFREDFLRILRAVRFAARFGEDGLRALRAVRFAAQLGFRLEPATHDAIRPALPVVGRVSLERVGEAIQLTPASDSAEKHALQPSLPVAVRDLLSTSRLGTADGAVGAAAAAAANLDFNTATAAIGAGAVLTAGGTVTVSAGMCSDADAFASGAAVNSGVALGIAAAGNITGQSNQATLAGSVDAPRIEVEAFLLGDGEADFRAEPISGGGAEADLGVAGAFAVNLSSPLLPLNPNAGWLFSAVLNNWTSVFSIGETRVLPAIPNESRLSSCARHMSAGMQPY